MAAERRSGGNSASSRASEVGTMAAAARPCSALAAISQAVVGARPHTAEVSAKPSRASRNSRRRPYWSLTLPAITSRAAKARE